MKTVTYEEFLEFDLYWSECGVERMKAYFDRFGGRMSALDILNLDDVSAKDRLWAVLREELIPAPVLHEFTCACAEYALSLIETPDPRGVNAIKVKRAWIRGEATDKELDAARAAARDAAKHAGWKARCAAREAVALDAAARAAAYKAAWAAALGAAKLAARDAAEEAAEAAGAAGVVTIAAPARDAARDAARDTARDAQVTWLIKALETEMKTVTYEEFLEFDLSGLEDGDGERIKAYFDRFGGRVSALDILSLNDASAGDRLWLVLREEFIPAPILHEFACVCVDYALTLVNNPDPCSIKAAEVKRAWLRGEATDKELAAAWNDARLAARVWAAGDDAWAVSFNARHAAWTAAGDVASDAARAAACYASEAAWEAARGDSRDAASDAAREAMVAYLIMTLEEEK